MYWKPFCNNFNGIGSFFENFKLVEILVVTVLRSIEEISKGFLRVADENTSLTSRFELVVSISSYESLANPNLDMCQRGSFPVHISWGVLATFLVGTWLRIWAAVSKAYPQKEIGSEAWLIIERTMSNRVRLRLSATPFNCGVLGGVNCETIPHSLR